MDNFGDVTGESKVESHGSIGCYEEQEGVGLVDIVDFVQLFFVLEREDRVLIEAVDDQFGLLDVAHRFDEHLHALANGTEVHRGIECGGDLFAKLKLGTRRLREHVVQPVAVIGSAMNIDDCRSSDQCFVGEVFFLGAIVDDRHQLALKALVLLFTESLVNMEDRAAAFEVSGCVVAVPGHATNE